MFPQAFANVPEGSALPSNASAQAGVEPDLCCLLAQWPDLAKGETEAQKGSTGLRSLS